MRARTKGKLSWYRVMMVGIMCYFAYIFVNQQMELSAIQRETAAAQSRLEQGMQMQNALLDEKEKLGTNLGANDYVEKIAREELGLVKPGEVPYMPAVRN